MLLFFAIPKFADLVLGLAGVSGFTKLPLSLTKFTNDGIAIYDEAVIGRKFSECWINGHIIVRPFPRSICYSSTSLYFLLVVVVTIMTPISWQTYFFAEYNCLLKFELEHLICSTDLLDKDKENTLTRHKYQHLLWVSLFSGYVGQLLNELLLTFIVCNFYKYFTTRCFI